VTKKAKLFIISVEKIDAGSSFYGMKPAIFNSKNRNMTEI